MTDRFIQYRHKNRTKNTAHYQMTGLKDYSILKNLSAESLHITVADSQEKNVSFNIS